MDALYEWIVLYKSLRLKNGKERKALSTLKALIYEGSHVRPVTVRMSALRAASEVNHQRGLQAVALQNQRLLRIAVVRAVTMVTLVRESVRHGPTGKCLANRGTWFMVG